MNTECIRVAEQLRRAFAGDPWHGPPLRDLLAGIGAEQAQMRPLPSAHSIGELVLHIDIYVTIAIEAMKGVAMPKLFGTERDWPTLENGAAAWAAATKRLFDSAERMAQAIDGFTDERLLETAPGEEYNFYFLLHGIVQHSLYHGGQIALLGKALR